MPLVQQPVSPFLRYGNANQRHRLQHRAVGNGVRLDHVEDRFISRLLQNCLTTRRNEFSELQDKSLRDLSAVQMPTRREESYRFTDIAAIVGSEVKKASSIASFDPESIRGVALDQNSDANRIVILNGIIQWKTSNIENEIQSFVRNAEAFPELQHLGVYSSERRGPFAMLNDALFENAIGIVMPKGVKLDKPLHLLYLSSGGDDVMTVNAPRLFIKCESDSRIQIVEEFMSLSPSSSAHLSLPVCEIELDANAELVHQYVQLDGRRSYHMKSTIVKQAAESKYRLIESSVGGELSRHDLSIDQDGDATETVMDHFHLSGDTQLHDLHSIVVLDHLSGVVNQLHKCIVASSAGSAVFDGNVQVNRMAQKTDAGQLSRSLLLAPKATVNAKPNLQIIADDVRCTHGCTVSDLSEEEVFYFRARGIDKESARRALVHSFGSEINQKLISKPLRQRVDDAVLNILSSA